MVLPDHTRYFSEVWSVQGSDFLQHGVAAGPLPDCSLLVRIRPSVGALPLVRGWAGASGKITEETHDWFVNNIVTQLGNQMNVTDSIPDALFLDLHGAAQAVHLDDCEGELIAKCRDVLGKEIPIVVALDHHANLTEKMVGSASAIVAHRTQLTIHLMRDSRLENPSRYFAGPGKSDNGIEKIPMLTHQNNFSPRRLAQCRNGFSWPEIEREWTGVGVSPTQCNHGLILRRPAGV